MGYSSINSFLASRKQSGFSGLLELKRFLYLLILTHSYGFKISVEVNLKWIILSKGQILLLSFDLDLQHSLERTTRPITSFLELHTYYHHGTSLRNR